MRTISAGFPVLRVSVRLACLPVLLLCGLGAARGAPPPPRHDATQLQSLVDEIKKQLGIGAEVTVTVVAANPLLVSVDARRDRENAFELSFEDAFLGGLSDDELRAVIAHELGHVWIFTHFPYLQTERGANDIAMRVVSRQLLEEVYAKVWAQGGTKGDLARFLSTQ